MGSTGVVMKKALRYGGYKVTHFQFNAQARTVHVGDKIVLDAHNIKALVSENGSISILENHYTANPVVDFHLKDAGLHFSIKFMGEHLDMFWHSAVKSSESHGLIGEPSIHTFKCTVIVSTTMTSLSTAAQVFQQ